MAGPAPSVAVNRTLDIGRSFEQFDLEASHAGFIGLRVFPHINVKIQAAAYGRIKLDSLLRGGDTKRGTRGTYNRGSWDFDTDSYATKENGWEEPVDIRNSIIYKNFFDAEMIAAKKARDVVMRNYEKRIAAKVFDTTVWTGATLTKALANKWSDAVNGTPQNDVNNAIQNIYNNSGILANAVVMDWTVYKALQLSAQIQSLIKFAGLDDPKDITTKMLAAVFDVEQVIVAGGRYNSANEGQTTVLTNVWDKTMVMVCRVASTSGDTADIVEPCVGRTIHFAEDGSDIGGVMESYYEDQSRAEIIRCRMDTDEKVTYSAAGFLLTNVQ